MKVDLVRIGRLGTFSLGVVATVAVVGTVNYAFADGSSTIVACANKSTGAMRLLGRGNCQKTETRLTWNEQGPSGSAGAKGDSGPAGANGQNLFAVDANGATIGPVWGMNGATATVEINAHIWTVDLFTSNFSVGTISSDYWGDNTCTQPFGVLEIGHLPSAQHLLTDYGLNTVWDVTDKTYQVTGSPLTFSGRSVYGRNDTNVCVPLSTLEKTRLDASLRLFAVGPEIPRPTYVAPVTIVAR